MLACAGQWFRPVGAALQRILFKFVERSSDVKTTDEGKWKGKNRMRKICAAAILSMLLLSISVYGGHLVFPDALVAHWAFDEMSGSEIADSSSNHLNGEIEAGIWTDGASACDGAVDLRQPGEAVFFPADGSPAPDQIASLNYGSIAIRFRFPETGSSAVIPIFCLGQRTAQQAEQFTFILEIGHGNDPQNRKLYFTIIDSGFCFDTGINLLPDTWYHFVGVVGPNGNTGYLNGQELTQRHYNLGSTPAYTNFFSSVPNRECMTIGCGRYGGDFVYGPATVSDLQIYRRPLTAGEISALWADTMDPVLFRVESPSLEAEGSGFVMRWPSDSNYIYSILQSGSVPGEWQPVPEFGAVPATPPLNTVMIPVEETPSRLFRVQATLRH
jgi:hypothetical protein